MDRTLSLEFARVVEAAALRSGRLLGRGQEGCSGWSCGRRNASSI